MSKTAGSISQSRPAVRRSKGRFTSTAFQWANTSVRLFPSKSTESKALTQPLDLPLAQTETKTDPPDLQHFTRAHLAKPRCTAARPGAKPWLGLSDTLASSASAAPGAGLRSRAVRPSLTGNTSSPLCSTTGCSSPSLLLNERAR